jgi:anaerobic selenocysteine-containing dehydrogenase
VTWNRREKPQHPDTKFRIHATDAPNVNGARDLGFTVGAGNDGAPDLSALRTAVEGGRVKALYVIDPGPDGSIGDVSWVVTARRSGKLPLLIVQGVVTTNLTTAADIVLPGAAWVEKDAIYTNEQGLVQASSKVINPPGEAREDWQILANIAALLGLTMPYQSSDDVRKALSVALPGSKYSGAHTIAFARPISASNWLQASNPSERWKWDFLYQDLPPVKGHNVQMEGAEASPSFIPLKPID